MSAKLYCLAALTFSIFSRVLGDISTTTIIPDPSWTCGLPNGILPPILGTFVFNASLAMGSLHYVGNTQYGNRRLRDIKGGSVQGPRISASVVTGGLDFELALSNGQIELEQYNILKTNDGTNIFFRTCGVAPVGERVRVVLDFEAPQSGSYAFLNTGTYVGTRVITAGAIILSVYDVSRVTAPSTKITLKDPVGVPNQSWECSTLTGSRGAQVFTESVALGSSISISNSKRGTRNIIPITGGTASGRVTGSVLFGGADYQLISGSSAVLDARYTVKTKDNEYVLIRNCGKFGALIPVFETRDAGPYGFLNKGTYLSADPVVSGSSVGITIYERK